MRGISFVLVLWACSLAAVADREPPDLRGALEQIRLRHDLPALGAAVIQNGELAAVAVAGERKYGSGIFCEDTDQFHLGSCTKAMTATLVGMLIDEGKLCWDTKILDVFPELADTMHAGYRDVTIEHLLAHRSGLTGESWPEGTSFVTLHLLPGSPTEQRLLYLREMLKQAPEAAPGEKFIYANAGYAILGAMAERVAGVPWEELITDRLFLPLSMKSAGFGAMGEAGAILQPWQHRMADGKRTPVEPGRMSDNPRVIGPAGTVHCSLADWAQFARLHLGVQGVPRLLKPETLGRLHTAPFGGDYAGGWGVCERGWAGGMALTHAGSNTMNFAVAWLAPARKYAVLVVTNQADIGERAAQACDEAAAKVIFLFPPDQAGTSGSSSGE